MLTVCIAGWVLLTWAQAIVMMYLGRLLQGFAAGAYSMSVPIYIGEIADQRIRGTVGSFFQLMLNLGMLMSFSISADVNVFQLNIISGFIVLLFGPIFMLMPETPSCLVGVALQSKEMKKMKLKTRIFYIPPRSLNGATKLKQSRRSNGCEDQNVMLFTR